MSDAKYEIAFYQTRDGECQVWDFLEGLRMKAATNKDARIQHKQASLYIELLSLNGTNMNENITKHLEEDIWELRPGNNRVFYFYYIIYTGFLMNCCQNVAMLVLYIKSRIHSN